MYINKSDSYCTAVLADSVLLRNIYQRYQQSTESSVAAAIGDECFYRQRLDHFNPLDNRTFQQRYYIDTSHIAVAQRFKNDYPIFLYVGGESELRASSVFHGYAASVAKHYKGLLVGVEHRYYGVSHPFDSLTTENLRYLSSDQALHDLAEFTRHLQQNLPIGPGCLAAAYAKSTDDSNILYDNDYNNEGQLPLTASAPQHKLIVIGGSYPANLAAWFRAKFPHLAVGAWASSAPVQAKSDYYEYDQVVRDQLGSQCAQSVHQATERLEFIIQTINRTLIDSAKNQFHPLMSKQVPDDIAFLYVLADIVAYTVQYDNPGMGLRQRLCAGDSMKINNSSNSSSMQRLAEFSLYFFHRLQLTPAEMDMTAYRNRLSTNPSENMRQWLWQSCTEFGYWQTAPRPPHPAPLRSRLIDERWHMQRICTDLFGFPADGYQVPVDRTNQRYGSVEISRSVDRIFFTNGQRDPWKVLSVPREMQRKQSPVRMIDAVGHCADLRSPSAQDPVELQNVREQVKDSIGRWLRG